MEIKFKKTSYMKDAELYKNLKLYCIKTNKFIIDVIEVAIREYLDRHDGKDKDGSKSRAA